MVMGIACEPAQLQAPMLTLQKSFEEVQRNLNSEMKKMYKLQGQASTPAGAWTGAAASLNITSGKVK